MIQSKLDSYTKIHRNIPFSDITPGNNHNIQLEKSIKGLTNTSLDRKFSSKIHQHGHWRDNSLQSETRKKIKDIEQKQKKKNHLDHLNSCFEKESENVKRIQNELIRKQHEMANVVIEKYSALTIQVN
jgi:hypothetical protein